MKSWRLLLCDLAINDVPVEVTYADLFVVLREGDHRPGPNDWEAIVTTPDRRHVPPGRHHLHAHTPDGLVLAGPALLLFSDGHQHHLRGDGALVGVDEALA